MGVSTIVNERFQSIKMTPELREYFKGDIIHTADTTTMKWTEYSLSKWIPPTRILPLSTISSQPPNWRNVQN